MSKARRSLKMHSKLLMDVIQRQAGVLDKAILEGVMNAVEALQAAGINPGRVDIEFTPAADGKPAHLRISDKGKGIRDEAEVEAFFETFGTPHDESETVIWKQFRMGRGQLFSFGVNRWRTATFNLTVDIQQWGLEYDFENDLPFVEGCVIDIDLYKNPVGNGYNSMEALKAAVKQQVEFMSTPIFFNGEQLSTDPATLTWDDETDEAYFLWARGANLTVYNLGALCKTIPASTAGVTGVVVSKKQLKINFARNDIQHDCPVWKEINYVIRENRVKKTRNVSQRLDRHERIAALQDLRDGEQDYNDLKNVALLATTSGRSLSLHFIRNNRQHWTFATPYDRLADKLMQANTALCISNEVLKELSYTGEPSKFFDWLLARQSHRPDFSAVAKLYRKFDALSSGFSRTATLLPLDQLNAAEKRILRLIQGYDHRSKSWGSSSSGLLRGRTICIGVADAYDGWTDGQTYIAINRFFLKRVGYANSQTGLHLMALLAHELAHDDDDLGSHVHGEEFYRAYHDLTQTGSMSNPLYWIEYYQADCKRLHLQERMQAEVDKQNAAKERIDRKLRRKQAARQPDEAAPIAASVGQPDQPESEPEETGGMVVPEPKRRYAKPAHFGPKGKRMPKGAFED